MLYCKNVYKSWVDLIICIIEGCKGVFVFVVGLD